MSIENMDFNYHCCHQHLISWWQPKEELAYPTPVSSSVDVRVEFLLRTVYAYIIRSEEEGIIALADQEQDSMHVEVLNFKAHEFMFSYNLTYNTLHRMMHRLGVKPTFRDEIVKEIIWAGRKVILRDSNVGRRILPLCLEIVNLVEFVRDVGRTKNGMVPASVSSIESLKRVRMEGDDEDCEGNGDGRKRRCLRESQDCAICLEGFPVRSYATRMPCSHVFHEDCIKRWLNESHYCPICRFEMPT